MSTVAECEHCKHMFEVANALMGGITNCPECGKATEITGLNDPMWRLAQIGGLALAIAIGIACEYSIGHGVGWFAGAIAAAGLWLLGRAF